ncbi:class I SAM-dependent methyltransferase [Granulicella sibirica]|uniref:Methyltransferase type 11 n=1 Tax=Granulicella sibirica TaxID=2479048 RepID=A0A4Q0SWK0_9BACT|nr:class I SAM-dependent methyltransferase [Granulicella sibirica]RXH54320.1 Methyltransferase type 11 [Granulicella sibirica]
MEPNAPSLQQIKDSMRATWMAGDFGVVAKTISGNAEEFISRLTVPPGTRVLDVACGTGNLAIPLARAGAIVTGVDIAANLLVQARDRAAAEGLSVTFDEGDAEQLPYPDASFDAVVTMFGAMFAPRPEVVASELARVLKPGGLLAMANWNPASFSGLMFKVGGKHTPHPPTIPPPVLWGDGTTVRQRLAPYFTGIETELIPIDFDLPTSPAGAVAFFRTYFGPTHMAYKRLDEVGQQALTADLEALWTNANVSQDPANHTLIRNEYLQVTATRS